MQYLWLAVLVLSVVLETMMTRAAFLCFIPAALVATFLAFFEVEVFWQVGIFFLLSGLGLIFALPLARKMRGGKDTPSFSVESAIGSRCLVVERLDNLAGRGAVSVGGMEWAARSLSDDIVIEEGTQVEIIAVEGVKYICRTAK